MKKQLAFNVFIYIFIGLFALISIGPYIWVLLSTFKSNIEIFRSTFSLPQKWLFRNYLEAWEIGKFALYFKNSIIISILSIGIMPPVVIFAAYPFAKMDFYGRKVLLSIFLMGLIIPFYSIMVSLYFILRNLHLLDTHLAMVLPLVGLNIPFGIFLMRSFLVSLPSSLLDAARIDGCTELQVFVRVVLPLSKAAIVSVGIFQLVLTWNAFLIPLLYTQSDWIRPITLGLMYFEGRHSMNCVLTMAGCIIVSLPLLIAFLIFQRGFIRGLVSGAFK